MNDMYKIALVGTAQAGATSIPSFPEVQELTGRLSELEPEQRLLLNAGVQAIMQFAGKKAETENAAPSLCPPESTPYCNRKAAEMFTRFAAGDRLDLACWALEQLHASKRLLPPESLPILLSFKNKDFILPVLGERGRWLARTNPEWAWVLHEEKSPPIDEARKIWEEGNFNERLLAVKSVRASNPSEARAWIAKDWKQENANRRRLLITVLKDGLSHDDEEFLETVLKDKAYTLRKTAASLLVTLTDPPLLHRICDRANSWLKWTPHSSNAWRRVKSIFTGSSGILDVVIPDSWNGSWTNDGIKEKPPAKIGKRAYWFTQTVALVPPSFWEERFNSLPEDIIKAARQTDFGSELSDAFTTAAILHNSTEWMLPLLNDWLENSDTRVLQSNPEDELIRGLSPVDLHSLVVTTLKKKRKIPEILEPALKTMVAPWPEDVSHIFLDRLNKETVKPIQISNGIENKILYRLLPLAAISLSNSCFDKAMHLLDFPDVNHHNYLWQQRKALDEFKDCFRIRKQFLEELSSE